jgi:ribosomal protein L37AE/L43A
MRLEQVAITEAAKKICPICHNPMAGYHFWYKGSWKCKKSSLQGAGSNAPTTPVGSGVAPTIPTPPTLAPSPFAPPRSTSGKGKATVDDWLKRHGISDYAINPDGTIDVKGPVFLDDFYGARIPAKFNKVGGAFTCAGSGLTTLENCPVSVGGDFRVSHNVLTSLAGFPKHVGGTVDISDNVTLSSLEGMEGVTIGGSLFGERLKQLVSLKGIHKCVKSVGNKITFADGGVKSNILGAMMIPGVKHVDTGNREADKIMNDHLKSDQDSLAAQDEMIDAGFTKLAGV